MADQPAPTGVAWTMQLKGHDFDLEDLAHWTLGNPISVVKARDRYDLVMPFGEVGLSHKEVRARAEAHVATLNGLGALFGSSFAGVELDSTMYTIDETGARRDAVVQVQGIEVRAGLGRPTITVNGVPVPDPTKGMAASYVAVATELKAVEDALVLVGRQNPTWSELYVAYELVEAALNGQLVKNGWVSARDLERFKHTVNSYNALGVRARHADLSRAAPKNPMTHADAIALIRGLVASWLKGLADQRANAANQRG